VGSGTAQRSSPHPPAQPHGLEHQDSRVAARGKSGGGLGQRVLLGERQRERGVGVDQATEPVQAGDLAAVDVVEHGVAVLREEAQDRDEVLRDVGDRDDEQRAWHVDAPGVVALQVGLLSRQMEPSGRELPQPAQVALRHELGREAHAGVVGEEELGGVEAGRGREGPAGGRAGVVRGVRRVVGVPGDGVVPPGGPAHGAQHQDPLELGQRLRVLTGPVGQRAVRDLVTQREPPRAAPEQGLREREGGQILQRVAPDVVTLRTPGARDPSRAWWRALHRTCQVARIHDAVPGKADIE
jgi:hypothetical protein